MSAISTSFRRRQVFVAVDIERTGPFLVRNKTNSIGFFVGNDRGDPIIQKKVNIEVQWPDGKTLGDFEPTCWHEFWAKQPEEVLNGCKKFAIPIDSAFVEVAQFLQDLERAFPEDCFEIIFLTDNPSFDIANIDFGLEMYAKRKPMRFSSTSGEYRSIIVVDDLLFFMPDESQESFWLNVSSKMKNRLAHDALSDAEKIYRTYIEAVERKQVKGNCSEE